MEDTNSNTRSKTLLGIRNAVIGVTVLAALSATVYGTLKANTSFNDFVSTKVSSLLTAQLADKTNVEKFDTIKTTVWFAKDMTGTKPLIRTVMTNYSVCVDDMGGSSDSNQHLTGAISDVIVTCDRVTDLINKYRGK